MKQTTRSYAALLALLMLTACSSDKASKMPPSIPYDASIEAKVEKTLAELTLEEKIGQMCEITIDQITDFKQRPEFALSDSMLEVVFDHYKVGSILNVPLSIAQTPEVWAKTIRTLNDRSMAATGVPQIYGVDQIHGATYTWGATFFPQEINQAASFNREIPYRVSQISAYESRAGLIPWVYAPVMDLGRQPMWSRQWESFGEDAYVNSEMAMQAVRGFQGDDPNHIDPYHVAVCLKHYMAYGVPVSGKDRTPSAVSEREMREKYFEPFKNCARIGALSIMVNSGVNNGVPFHADHEMLTVWFKEGLNWDGMIVTDWADINNLCTRDHIAATKKDAIEIAINAGIDMSMVPYEVEFCDLLLELVEEKRVPMSRIDDAVRRILRLKYRLGLFDTETWDIEPEVLAEKYPDFGSDKFAAEAVKMAEECIVLLKNDGILPLRQGSKILVTGPNADDFRGQTGGWSYSWQGDKAEYACRTIGKYKTFYEAIRDKFGEKNVTLVKGVSYPAKKTHFEKEEKPNIEAAVRAAQNVDVIVAVIGENSYCETPGNLDDLNISANQQALIQALAKTGKPIVMVLNEGRPRIIKDIEPLSAATIDAMLPSNYGGEALANLLSGEANFSAKLPFTYPRHTGALVTYDYKPCENMGQMDGNYNYDAVMDVLYPFGHGLSYTTYAYSNFRVDKSNFTVDDELSFSIDVTNTGAVAGKEPVLLYVSDLVASITPDNRRLRAFDKVALEPGETKTVTLRIKASDLAFVGIDNHWRLEAGEFRAVCGGQAVTFSCDKTHRWETPNREG